MRQDTFLDDRYIGRGLGVEYPDGEVLPQHSHSWAQFAYAETGVMQLHTPEAAWLVPTTRAIWIPAGQEHWIEMRGRVRMASFYVSGRVGVWPEACRALEVTPLLRELTLYLVRRRWLDPNQPADAHLCEVFASLVAEAGDVPLGLPMPSDPRARALARLLLERPFEPNLDVAARQSGASLRTQQRLFRKETGLSLDEWRVRTRIQLAVVLLSQKQPVSVVADAVGYGSAAAFSVAFKRITGVSPSRYAPVM